MDIARMLVEKLQFKSDEEKDRKYKKQEQSEPETVITFYIYICKTNNHTGTDKYRTV